MTNTILPDTSLTLAFRIAGMVSYEDDGIQYKLPLSVISGLRKSSRSISYSPDAVILLAVFTEGGGSAFFSNPLHELFNSYVSLDNFIRYDKLNDLEGMLAEAGSNSHRIGILEQFLLGILKISSTDLLIMNAIEKIKQANGTLQIRDLANHLCISQDPFEKRFRKVTGSSPKHFSSVIRLKNAIATHTKSKNITDIALSAGYFDQAHFIKDFKGFTGKTPLQFFKSGSYW